MSNRWKDWTGYSPEYVYKDHETWPKSIHQEDRNGTIKKVIDAFKEKTEYTLEYRIVHEDIRDIRYVRDRGVPIFDEKGNISRFDGVISDITKSKEAERKLRESETKYRNLFELSPYIIMLTGAEALEELKSNIPKLILLDILLPDIDGFEICSKIKSNENLKKVPVFYITAVPRSKVAGKMSETGADGYFLKPFDFSQFKVLFDYL